MEFSESSALRTEIVAYSPFQNKEELFPVFLKEPLHHSGEGLRVTPEVEFSSFHFYRTPRDTQFFKLLERIHALRLL